MFPGIEVGAIRPSLGFWASEGVAPGLTLAGLRPLQPGPVAPDEVHAVTDGHCGRLLRWLSRAEVAEAP